MTRTEEETNYSLHKKKVYNYDRFERLLSDTLGSSYVDPDLLGLAPGHFGFNGL